MHLNLDARGPVSLRGPGAGAAARGAVGPGFINTAYVASPDSSLGCFGAGVPLKFKCPLSTGTIYGNISNEPHIEFEEKGPERCNITPVTGAGPIDGTIGANFCNDKIFLCTQIGVANSSGTEVSLDEINFELFKFQDGSNALDPASTPPLRTFFLDALESAGGLLPSVVPNSGTEGYCVMWDGSANIQGEFGKTNGQYGFRVTVKTNQVGESGNILITATRAYPSGATKDVDFVAVPQKPIVVDVTNIHVVRSSPTLVGQITAVAAQPYNFTYRLSKDATMYLTINEAYPPYNQLRRVVPGLPKIGEGMPQGTVLNGDSWDGRDENGNVMPVAVISRCFRPTPSISTQLDGTINGSGDLSQATTRQVALDPLQITDIRVQPLVGGSTSLAVMSYMLTEAATVYIDIYRRDAVLPLRRQHHAQ